MPAVGYVRVSTEKQADVGISLEAQTEKIQAMAVVQGLELDEVIIDAGESAKSLSRPGMERLLRLVDSGAIETVIVAKLDRLTRSVKDLAELLEHFNRRGASLVSVAESLDTASASDLFGSDVSISGHYAIVGAPFHDAQDPERDVGAAYVFKRENGTWQQEQKLIASDGEQWDAFGGAIAIDGHRAAIGAPLNNTLRGAVYIFELAGGVWRQAAKLLPSRSRSFFGLAVALSGDRVIIGAPHDDEATGAAYIFERTGNTWREVVKLFAPNAEEGDFFGRGLAISGDWALVGSERDDDGCTDLPPGGELFCESGAVYAIQRTSGTWQVQEKLIPSDVEFMDFFGFSIAMDGDRAAIGAFGDDDACPPGPITSEDPRFCDPGAAYVYELIDGQWQRVNKLTASDAMESAILGIDVAISGNRIIAGAPDRSFDELPDDFGAAYVYDMADDMSHEITNVLDAAGFLALISPGSIVSVFGSFAEQTAVGNIIPLLVNLDGFSVTFDGVPGALFGVFGDDLELGFNQANVQVPWEVDVSDGEIEVRVHWEDESGEIWSAPFTVSAGLASPGIFQFPVGSKQAVVTNFKLSPEDDVINGSFAQPPAAVAPVTGQPPPGVVPLTTKTVRVFIGGMEARIIGSPVLQPTNVGLNQINVFVPNVMPGDKVPIVIEVDCGNGEVFRSSGDVTIAVRAAP